MCKFCWYVCDIIVYATLVCKCVRFVSVHATLMCTCCVTLNKCDVCLFATLNAHDFKMCTYLVQHSISYITDTQIVILLIVFKGLHYVVKMF